MKGLQSQNLRDHMSEAELIFTALAELSTRQIAETEDATGMDENKTAAKTGGRIAKKARKELEEKTGRKVVSSDNYLPQTAKKVVKEAKPKKASKNSVSFNWRWSMNKQTILEFRESESIRFGIHPGP